MSISFSYVGVWDDHVWKSQSELQTFPKDALPPTELQTFPKDALPPTEEDNITYKAHSPECWLWCLGA